MGGDEDTSSRFADLLSTAAVDVVGRVEPDAAGVVLAVVPGEAIDAVGARVLDAAEALRKVRPVFQGLKTSLGERVVVRDVRISTARSRIAS